MNQHKPSCITCKKYKDCGYRLASNCSCCICYEEKPTNNNELFDGNDTFNNLMDMFKMKK